MTVPAALSLHSWHENMTPSPARRAGILVPLFSIPSTRSWGIGEIADIEHLAAWLQAAGQRVLQLLPLNEMPLGGRSPYSALSAMAIDPQFIAMRAVEDFDAIGGDEWDDQLESFESGWPGFFEVLRIYLRHDADARIRGT